MLKTSTSTLTLVLAVYLSGCAMMPHVRSHQERVDEDLARIQSRIDLNKKIKAHAESLKDRFEPVDVCATEEDPDTCYLNESIKELEDAIYSY
jgi:hypothetical protein